MTGLDAWASAELARLEAEGLRRHPPVLGDGAGTEALLDGRCVLVLCSNSYLGLATDPRVTQAAADAALRWGAGAGASRLVSGTTDLHLALEQELADLEGCEDALLFSSGYLANTGTIPALVGAGDVVLSDELNHASIVDGCRLSRARREVYRHADAADLARRLAAAPERRRLVVTDTVFSMDGDLAPLENLWEVCERHDAVLMIDEAHATGVVGPDGGGAAEACGLRGRVPVVMGTLSKALGSAGGFVAGSHVLVEALRNRARTHIFDTAVAPAAAGAALRAVPIVREEPWRRERARGLARTLHRGLVELGYRAGEPAAAVLPVHVGEPEAAVRLAAGLLERGVLAPAIRPPSVPPGTARLRLTVMATHTDEHIGRALDAFAAVRPQRAAGLSAGRRAGTRAESAIDPRIVRSGGVFVTGTDTGVGKTVVTAAIARALRGAGTRPAAMKVVQTGSDEADDLAFVVATGGVDAALARAPYRLRAPLAPLVAAELEGVRIDIDRIQATFRALRDEAGLVVVEGAGGLLVPVTDEVTMGGVAAGLGLPVVVVARPGLGTINHTCLTVAAARSLGLVVAGIVLSGFPVRPGAAEATNPRVLERFTGVALAGCIPRVDGLDVEAGRAGAAFAPHDWLAPQLGGRWDRTAFVESLEREVSGVTGA